MENATPTENPPAEAAPAEAALAPLTNHVVTADIEAGEQTVRTGRIVALTAAQAEAHAASIRPATASDLAIYGRAPLQLD